MQDSENSSLIKGQLKNLLSQVKNSDKSEIEVDIYLQIYSVNKTEKDSKKVYIMALCDDEYKYNSFFLACNGTIENIDKGKIIHIKEISPKKIKTQFFIRLKEYEILENPASETGNVKEIKEKDDNFEDEQGNDIFSTKEEKSSLNNDINKNKNENTNENSSMPMEEDAYTSLKQLTTFSRDFIIFVRVTKKSEIKTFETRNNNMNNSSQENYFISLF